MEHYHHPVMLRRTGVLILAIAIVGLLTATASRAWSITQAGENRTSAARTHSPSFDLAAVSTDVQDDTPSPDDDKDVPPKMVEKYTNAYKAMQKDHNITADQAAAAQGLTTAQFRSIEGRIERDDTLRERVRKALRNATPGGKDAKDSLGQ